DSYIASSSSVSSPISPNWRIVDVINQVIYTTAEKVKYPSDEYIMQICYDTLINAGNDNFNKKMKNGGSWKRFFNKHIHKIAQRFCRQACSNIVQHVFMLNLWILRSPRPKITKLHVKQRRSLKIQK
ncbi:hypothetical protein RhiirA4_428787, partial [Rhizophagus irregularis]